jgi:DNA helicase-2/ATP-dependent DNA helicase PcrA
MFPLDLLDGAEESSAPAHRPSSLLDNLNDEQLAAVTLPAGHALILAGAGSGKTRVLTTRIAWLLQTGQVTPGGILAVTFTNKAAKEMLARLSAMLPSTCAACGSAPSTACATACCARTTRRPACRHLPDPGHAGPALGHQAPVQAVQGGRGALSAQAAAWFIAGCKEEGMRPGTWWRRPRHAKKVELYQLYEEQCQREGVVDFGELMLRSYELLRDDARCASTTSGAFATSWWTSSRTPTSCSTPGSSSWRARWWAAPAGRSVMAVGDDDQSIYAFAARAWATWPTSCASSTCSTRSSWSRTTAATATSWTAPTR